MLQCKQYFEVCFAKINDSVLLKIDDYFASTFGKHRSRRVVVFGHVEYDVIEGKPRLVLKLYWNEHFWCLNIETKV